MNEAHRQSISQTEKSGGKEEMRFDKDGRLHSLDQDIVEIWRAHGWEVVEEKVPRSKGRKKVWIITAKPAKR